MNTENTSLKTTLVCVAGALLIACMFTCGCQEKAKTEKTSKPIFFPKAPDKPRLQFLVSYGSLGELGGNAPSGFEKFIVGESKVSDQIIQPYGATLFEGTLYVCDIGTRMIRTIDVEKRTYGVLTKDRRLMNPVNIFIEDDGTKYVADPTAGAVFVFDRDDELRSILGRDLKISPIDVATYGPLCYVTDFASNQVVVFYKKTGKLVARLGSVGEKKGQFQIISDLALDSQANIYVTDKSKGNILHFERSGKLKRVIGRLGDNIDEFVRVKGIAIDREGRIWVVDAGPEVAKIYNQKEQLLLFFGRQGTNPGTMNIPATIDLNYDDVELFQKYAVKGAQIEFLVIVTNQYGPHKVSIYGFGNFPGL